MTIQQLIDELSLLRPDWPVAVFSGNKATRCSLDIVRVKTVKAHEGHLGAAGTAYVMLDASGADLDAEKR